VTKVVAINGSPRMERGNTARVLTPFLDGMREAGAEVELFFVNRLRLKPCACGEMYCWDKKPGECCINDEMQQVYPKLRAADVLVLATPVYIPLPGRMQDFINRLCPLVDPVLATRDGRTRARFRNDVGIKRIVLVAVSGWWEKENLDTVVRIAEELAANAGVEFAGALLRPHAYEMNKGGQLTDAGKSVHDAARKAGRELVADGMMRPETLEAVSRPLVTRDDQMRG